MCTPGCYTPTRSPKCPAELASRRRNCFFLKASELRAWRTTAQLVLHHPLWHARRGAGACTVSSVCTTAVVASTLGSSNCDPGQSPACKRHRVQRITPAGSFLAAPRLCLQSGRQQALEKETTTHSQVCKHGTCSLLHFFATKATASPHMPILGLQTVNDLLYWLQGERATRFVACT